MDGTGDKHIKQKKPNSERQISRFLSYVESRFFTKDMKVEGGLLGKRKGTRRQGKGKPERVMRWQKEVHYKHV
jgi:hypothetical protein